MRLSNGDVLFAWPLDNHIVTSGWTYNDNKAHNAIDLRAAIKTPVYAAEDGTVDWTQDWDERTTTGMMSYGTGVRIRHADYSGGALQTRYAHLSKRLVKTGDQVREGQLIGYSGATGNCRGAHLHFEVIYRGVRCNPLNWLDSDFTVKDAATGAHLGSYTSVERPKADKPAAQMQRIRVTCGDPEDGAQLGRLLATLQVPLEATVSNGDALNVMRVAQTLGAEYKSEYVG